MYFLLKKSPSDIHLELLVDELCLSSSWEPASFTWFEGHALSSSQRQPIKALLNTKTKAALSQLLYVITSHQSLTAFWTKLSEQAADLSVEKFAALSKQKRERRRRNRSWQNLYLWERAKTLLHWVIEHIVLHNTERACSFILRLLQFFTPRTAASEFGIN